MTKLQLFVAAVALLISSPAFAQEERAHQRRIPHRPDRPVSIITHTLLFEFLGTACSTALFDCLPLHMLLSNIYLFNNIHPPISFITTEHQGNGNRKV